MRRKRRPSARVSARGPAMDNWSRPLQLEEVDARNWRLLEALEYRRQAAGVELRIEAPKGEVTDLASVPRILWNVFPPYGKHTKAAVIHDRLYKTGVLPRFLADAIFRDAMEASGVPLWRRWFMWAAVRLFGAKPYQGRR